MADDAPVRMMLVDILAAIPGKAASIALAQRAVFDLSPEVRGSAVEALQERPRAEVRDVFVRAMRYPWAPAADHAAEALVSLDDKEAVPQLVSLLKEPDPAAPYSVGKYHVVQEVVRAAHLQNCLMCHPPAFTGGDPCLGLDPVVTIPATPSLSSAAGAIQRTPGAHGYGRGSPGSGRVPLLIRGDVTYLRQDFSVQQPVLQAVGAAQNHRFDYLVRTRLVSTRELQTVPERNSYEQREAVLFALRGLTGKNPGDSTDAWRQLFPRAELDVEADKLTREVLGAPAERREWVVLRLRDAKGVVNTVALANAIPALKAADQEQAREALIVRLTRMTPDTLRDKFHDDDLEVRRAAILACLRKDDKQHIPDLIALLEDPEPLISRTALAGLKMLTDRDFETPAAWKEWWQKETP
jgi:HEAT repeat protein